MIGFRLQSYDIYSKVVSVAYGKYAHKSISQINTNQAVIQIQVCSPMEKYRKNPQRLFKDSSNIPCLGEALIVPTVFAQTQ